MSKHERQLDEIFRHNKDYYEDDLTTYEEPHIRVLLIEPGNFRDPIVCGLKSYPLRPDLVYRALSYAWGNGVEQHSITLNGKADFRIADGAYGALRRLRHAVERRYLWIDAICINQANIKERSTQVAMMAKIFSFAELVYVWLGPCGVGKPVSQEREDCSFHSVAADGDITFLSPGGLFTEPLCEGHAVGKAQWWWRTWAVQEIALAREIEVLIGPHHVSWEKALKAFKQSWLLDLQGSMVINLDIPDKTTNRTRIAYDQLSNFETIRAQRDSVGRHLRYLMEIASNLVASDPRDKVYGMLGLMQHDSESTLQITPDYNKRREEVFADATRYFINSEQSLDILVEHWHRCSRPSWALDFTQYHRSRPKTLLQKDEFNYTQPPQDRRILRGYCAGRGSILDYRVFGQCLISRGIKFDVVKIIYLRVRDSCKVLHNFASTMLTEAGMNLDVWRAMDPPLEKWTKRATDSQFANFGVVIEQYLRTTTADHHLRTEDGKMIPQGSFHFPPRWGRNVLQLGVEPGTLDTASYRTFFLTNRGIFGVGQPDISVNDVVVVLFGSNIPMVLRPSAAGDTYTLVGECWVSGIMYGELMDLYEEGKVTAREFCIE